MSDNNEQTTSNITPMHKKRYSFLYFVILLLIIMIADLFYLNYKLSNELQGLQNIVNAKLYGEVKNLHSTVDNKLYNEIEKLNSTLKNARTVYVYSLEELLQKGDVVAKRKQFEENIMKLNDELIEAEKKIKSIENANVKADVSDLYLNNIKLKREEVMNEYQKTIEELTANINKALAEVAEEKDVSVIFNKSAIAVTTPYIVDVTDIVAAKVAK